MLFPGVQVEDIYHYVKPTLSKATEPFNVVLHVGTNDLVDKTPKAVADGTVNLAKHIDRS